MEVKKQFAKAQGRLMTAMDAMLEVPSVDGAALTSKMAEKSHDSFIAFYAPWCPHCQRFVLHDGSGDPTKAPLERFNKQLHEDPATQSVQVLRFDVNAHRDIPQASRSSTSRPCTSSPPRERRRNS